jgi:adenylate cyclase
MEIERKFLIQKERWDALIKPIPVRIAQGYLHNEKSKTIRVRVKGDKGFLTIKGETTGISRAEFEYEIPVRDAHTLLLTMCANVLEKDRYEIRVGEHCWEADVFYGLNKGLLMAEIELKDEDEGFLKPDWVGEEVSLDPRYFNSYLAEFPFSTW